MEPENNDDARNLIEIMNTNKDIFGEGHYLEITYQEKFNIVTIFASKKTLSYLQIMLQKLIDSDLRGKHFHLDRSFGVIGNIESITIARKD